MRTDIAVFVAILVLLLGMTTIGRCVFFSWQVNDIFTLFLGGSILCSGGSISLAILSRPNHKTL